MNQPLSTIFDTLRTQNLFLKILVGVQILIIIIILLTQFSPPIVIRETENGAFFTKNYVFENNITAIDIDLFAKTFVKRLNFIDSFGIQENIPDALSMMDKNLQQYYIKNVINKTKISSIINEKNRTKTQISSIESSSNGPIIHCTVIFEREVIGFESNSLSKIVIRAEAIFETVSRSKEYPYGLKVNEYKEIRLT